MKFDVWRSLKETVEYNEVWRKKFVWLPRQVEDGKFVWLEYVEHRKLWDIKRNFSGFESVFYWRSEYRYVQK